VADHFTKINQGYSCLELFDDEGVAEIIDLCSFDPCDAEVAVNGGADVTNQEGIAGFGDKKGGVFGFWSLFDVHLDGFLGGFVQRNATRVVGLEGSDLEGALFQSDVLELDAG